MIRKRVLQIVLVLVGLLFLVGLYPLLTMHPDPGEAMLGAVYITLGFFLVLAAWNPPAHRSLIAFTAWSSLVHGTTMAVQALRNEIPRADLWRAVPLFAVIGIVLIALAPPRSPFGTGKVPDTLASPQEAA
jgi:hypothetical protein